jgi:hypothetical protein
MSIIVEEEKKEAVPFTLFIAGLVFTVALIITYYLFFIPVPGIEKIILPAELKSIEKISEEVSLDVDGIKNSDVYKSLNKKYATPPEFGTSYRLNPFLPF